MSEKQSTSSVAPVFNPRFFRRKHGVKTRAMGVGLLITACVALLGSGCASASSPGKVQDTGRGLDFVIDGAGHFVVESGEGGYLFTRDGAIFLSADAYLVNRDGYRIAPAMQLASDTHVVNIEPDGRVSYKRDGDVGAAAVGYLKLARFPNPTRVKSDGIYVLPTPESGEPTTHRPGTGGVGKLRSGALER
jgi:flagellar basal-body rod protein FlgG